MEACAVHSTRLSLKFVRLPLDLQYRPCAFCLYWSMRVLWFVWQLGSKNLSGTLQSNFQHVLLYENPELQQKARSCIPYKQLLSAAQQKLKLAQEAETGSCHVTTCSIMYFWWNAEKWWICFGICVECKLGEEDFLVLELLRWFKHDFFSWVDCLPCNSCGGPTQNSGSLSPAIDDLRWGAERVENHYCQSCQLCTRFPRFVPLFYTRVPYFLYRKVFLKAHGAP